MIEPGRRRHLVSHCDYKYLPRAIVLIESIAENSENYLLTLVCHDELSYAVMQEKSMENVQIVKLSEIEEYFHELTKKKSLIKPIEYIFLLTPFIIKFCLETFKLENIVYVDSDICFFGSIDSIFAEAQHSDVGITSHNFPSKLNRLEVNGKFNVGVLFFRNTNNGNRVLNWWADRCLESTSIEMDSSNVFGDQKYLDLFSTIYPDTYVYENLGINAAPWNCTSVSEAHGTFYINDSHTELVTFHFSGLQYTRHFYLAGYNRYSMRLHHSLRHLLYKKYVKRLISVDRQLELQKYKFFSPRRIMRGVLFQDFGVIINNPKGNS